MCILKNQVARRRTRIGDLEVGGSRCGANGREIKCGWILSDHPCIAGNLLTSVKLMRHPVAVVSPKNSGTKISNLLTVDHRIQSSR